MKLNDYRQMMAYMRRPGFQNGTMVPPQKPEQKTPFIDKLKNLKEVAPALMPRSKVSILKMYMDEALRDGEITQEQHTEMLMPYFGELGENVTEQIEVSDRENFADGTDKFLVKVGKPVKEGNVIEQEFMEVIGSKNRPETYKKTGVKKTLYKPQIIVKNKTVLTDDFGSKEDAVNAVKNYREKNPIKNAPPDVDTLDERKKKKYIDRKARQADIIARGGIPEGGMFAGTKEMHKGHAGNIRGSQMITGDKLIYTPSKINQAMAGSEGESRFTDLDYKIDATEKEIDKIKNSKMPAAKKKIELAKLDNKLVDYAGQSDGYKVVTLSDGTDYGGSFRKLQSIDPMDIFPGKTEVEIRDFIKNADPNNFDDQLKIRLFKENAPKLKAALLPGLEELVEGIKNIPDDIAKKRYFKLGVKALGPLGAYIGISDTYKALKDGKPVAEALEYGLIGTDLIGSTKDLMALSPEGKEARSVVKQEEMREQITDDFSSLDTDFDTPNVKSDMSRQEAERKWENAKKVREMENAARDKQIAETRAMAVGDFTDLITGQRFQPQSMPEQMMAVGGRVGYADGPDDPSKRKFIKLGAGLMSLPIIGKYLKFAAPVAEKTTEIIRRGADGIPDFILDLIAKVKLKAEEKGMKYFTGKSSDEFADVYQADDFVVTEQGNKITLKKRKQEGDMLEKDIEMEIETDPETGGITYKEATARPDAEGKLKDVEEFIDDIDLENMRKYTYDE